MVREDLINSAVSFLQDPSVAAAPVEKKIAFLQSKNLTQEEIDVSLARVGDGSSPTASAPVPQGNYSYRAAPPQQGYPPYPPYGWQQPPPEIPRRDWRDWFIMATVMGGVGYGIYFTAKRYIIPLIAPPTAPQLEQDKKTIDQSFEKAFSLLEQLNTDTEVLKAAEETRTQRLDTALSDLESVISSLKEADRKREDDARRNADEIRNLRDLIPKALEGQKDATDQRLKNLGEELKSLSKLIGNRVGTGAPASIHRPTSSGSGARLGYTPSASSSTVQPAANGVASAGGAPQSPGLGASSVSAPTVETVPERVQSATPRFGSAGRASIPAWQMAASKKSQEGLNGAANQEASADGTAVDVAT